MPPALRRVRTFRRSGLEFDVADGGPLDGEPLVMLHGWPGGATTWNEVAHDLGERGFRTLVPDQRGYSPGARPPGSRPYVLSELTEDVVGLLDAAGLDRAHVIGHDWGGAVGWALAASVPDRLATLTVLSTPHPRAMASALGTSSQAFRSSYIGAFQVPWVPERVLLAAGGATLRLALPFGPLREQSRGLCGSPTRARRPDSLTGLVPSPAPP